MLSEASRGFTSFKALSGRVRNTSWDLLVDSVKDSSRTCCSGFGMWLSGMPGCQSIIPVPKGGSCSSLVHESMDNIEYLSKNTCPSLVCDSRLKSCAYFSPI